MQVINNSETHAALIQVFGTITSNTNFFHKLLGVTPGLTKTPGTEAQKYILQMQHWNHVCELYAIQQETLSIHCLYRAIVSLPADWL